MFNTAEFVRNLRIQLPRRRIQFTTGLTILLVVILYLLIWAYTGKYGEYNKFYTESHRLVHFGKLSLLWLLFGQFVLLHIVAVSIAGGSMVQEQLRGTLILQRMTMLTPLEMVIGKLFGSTILYYYLAVILMPFVIISAILAQIPLTTLVWLYTLLIAGAIAWQAIALFISMIAASAEESSRQGIMNNICYGVGGFAGIVSLQLFRTIWDIRFSIFLSDPFITLNPSTLYFYNYELAISTVVLVLIIFAGIWALIGAGRVFNELCLIRHSSWLLWIFFASLEFIFLGFCWNYPLNIPYHSINEIYYQARDLMLFYISFNWMILMLLAATIVPTRNQLQEWGRVAGDKFSIFKHNGLRDAALTFVIPFSISILGLLLIWQRIANRLGEMLGEEPIEFSSSLLLVVVISYLMMNIAMVAIMQLSALYRFKAANFTGLLIWVAFSKITMFAGFYLGENSLPALLNPLLYLYIITEPNSSAANINIGLLIQLFFTVFSIAMMYLKWRRTKEEAANGDNKL